MVVGYSSAGVFHFFGLKCCSFLYCELGKKRQFLEKIGIYGLYLACGFMKLCNKD